MAPKVPTPTLLLPLCHLRFGEIVGVYLTRDLEAGQEVIANYGDGYDYASFSRNN